MRIDLVTLFPEFFESPLSCGLMQRACEKNIVEFGLHNPRDKATDRHKTVDDRPYGGGPGMVMLLEPLVKTLQAMGHTPAFALPVDSMLDTAQGSVSPGRILYMDPKGRPFTQEFAAELAREDKLTLICGRYEGIDARLGDIFPIESVCLGDFILNGGESAALAVIEAVSRLLPGFMGHEQSGTEESFSSGLLEYPHYTRPENYCPETLPEKDSPNEQQGRVERVFCLPVPEVLRSGDHKRIASWRRQQSLLTTAMHRPELFSEAELDEDDMDFVKSIKRKRPGRNLFCALVHYPVLDREKKSVAVSLTNLDIHDIVRSSCSYGLGGYYIVTPLEDQLALLQKLSQHWMHGAGASANSDRATAFNLVRGVSTLEKALESVQECTGQKPLVLGTSACGSGQMPFSKVKRELEERPVLLLFGTGQGLAPAATGLCDAMLPPLRWCGSYNHLSVRAAAAIHLDRILGDWY